MSMLPNDNMKSSLSFLESNQSILIQSQTLQSQSLLSSLTPCCLVEIDKLKPSKYLFSVPNAGKEIDHDFDVNSNDDQSALMDEKVDSIIQTGLEGSCPVQCTEEPLLMTETLALPETISETQINLKSKDPAVDMKTLFGMNKSMTSNHFSSVLDSIHEDAGDLSLGVL